jgi:hypothetical protein
MLYLSLINYLKFIEREVGMGHSLMLRISGDGRQISKGRGSVIVSFTIIDDIGSNQDPSQVHTLGLYQGDEKEFWEDSTSYVKNFWTALNSEIDDLRRNGYVSIYDSDIILPVEFTIASDWKFAAKLMGLVGPSGTQCCLWCEASKKKNEEWVDGGGVLRSHNRSRDYLDSNGYKLPSYLPSILWSELVLDGLHCALRIGDRLEILLAKQLKRIYGSEKLSKYLTRYCSEVINKVKVGKYRFSVTKGISDTFSFYPSLHGYQRLNLLEAIDFTLIFSKKKALTARLINRLWHGFFTIYGLLTKLTKSGTTKPCTTKTLSDAICKWKNLFLYSDKRDDEKSLLEKGLKHMYDDDQITPYIHALVHHVVPLVEKYGGLMRFSTQSLEYTNQIHTRYFHRKTSKQSGVDGALRAFVIREILVFVLDE